MRSLLLIIASLAATGLTQNCGPQYGNTIWQQETATVNSVGAIPSDVLNIGSLAPRGLLWPVPLLTNWRLETPP